MIFSRVSDENVSGGNCKKDPLALKLLRLWGALKTEFTGKALLTTEIDGQRLRAHGGQDGQQAVALIGVPRLRGGYNLYEVDSEADRYENKVSYRSLGYCPDEQVKHLIRVFRDQARPLPLEGYTERSGSMRRVRIAEGLGLVSNPSPVPLD